MRSAELTALEVDEAEQQLSDNLHNFEAVAIEPVVLDFAAQLIARHVLRGMDALQLASAVLIRRRMKPADSFLFIASDDRLLTAAAAEGLMTWNPALSPVRPLSAHPVN